MKFVDLFSGTGGIRLGFEQACKELDIESDCVFSSEIDSKACDSYELNFGERPSGDISEVKSLPEHDFLLAGFPCQSFSYAGKKKGFGDTRGTLFFEVERLLKSHRPKGFILENVRGLVTHDRGRTLETIVEKLTNLGYSIERVLLNSSNYSVPQNRVRIYIVGLLAENLNLSIRSDLGSADSHKFRTKNEQIGLFQKRNSVKIVKDILEDIVSPKYFCNLDFVSRLERVVGKDHSKLNGYRLIDYRGGKSIHSWELGIKGECTEKEIDFMNLLIANRRKKIFGTHQDGKALTLEQIKTFYEEDNLIEIIQALLSKGYLSCNDSKYNPVCGNMSFEVFKFLDPESISITLTASDTNRLGVVHKGCVRRITPREAARLQGFPESYKLLENDLAVYKQMGNAVSVPVIKALSKDLLVSNGFVNSTEVLTSNDKCLKKAMAS